MEMESLCSVWIVILVSLLDLRGTIACGGCTGFRRVDPVCQRTSSRTVSTRGWWGRTTYKTQYYTQNYCCDGYRLSGSMCTIINLCGGCQDPRTSPQQACVQRVTARVSATEHTSCGSWWRRRTCSKIVYKTGYRTERTCCGSFELSGTRCSLPGPTPAPPPVPTPPPVGEDEDTCGVRTSMAEGLIVGGSEARAGEFPWQVSIRKNAHLCGGTIIGRRWVLTAAHCVDNEFRWNLKIKIGELSLSSYDQGETQLGVSAIHVHPGYGSQYPASDIALLRTDDNIRNSDTVGPACLPRDNSALYVNVRGQISGWGQTSKGERDSSTRSDVLMKTTVVVRPSSDCTGYFESMTGALCVSDNSGGTTRSSCFGDSGGPMVMTSQGVSTVIGVAAFIYRTGCAMGAPFGYTNVAHYLDWIQNTMNDN